MLKKFEYFCKENTKIKKSENFDTHRRSTVFKNSEKFLNGVPFPHSPRRTMYAILLGSEAPVESQDGTCSKTQSQANQKLENLTGCRSINDASIWQLILELKHTHARFCWLRRSAWDQMLRLVAFVEYDDAIIIAAEPFNELLQSTAILATDIVLGCFTN